MRPWGVRIVQRHVSNNTSFAIPCSVFLFFFFFYYCSNFPLFFFLFSLSSWFGPMKASGLYNVVREQWEEGGERGECVGY